MKQLILDEDGLSLQDDHGNEVAQVKVTMVGNSTTNGSGITTP